MVFGGLGDLTTIILKMEDTMSDSRKELIMSTTLVHRVVRHGLAKAVGRWGPENSWRPCLW